MILILSTPHDIHAQIVMGEIQKLGAAVRLLDLSEFPQHIGLSMRYEGSERRFRFGCDQIPLKLEECHAVWWRRPQPPGISEDIIHTPHWQFAANEAYEALQGLWQSIDAFWINDPIRDLVAQRKAYQLRVAQEVGLTIPDTLITNCLDVLNRFRSSHETKKLVYKAFSATETEWRETRLLREEDLEMVGNLKYAPVIFQEYIEADVDLRITVVGEKLFPAAIYSQDSSYKIDFRMDMGKTRVEAIDLPPAVDRHIRAFVERLGLVYGAIDMRRTPDGRYVFLEVNPAGQWLFIEDKTGQSISTTLAELLVVHGH